MIGFHQGMAQKADSAALLKNVTVTAAKKKNPFTNIMPVQILNSETLQQINAPSIGDAARYFSGVLIKDYGGTGGFKSISVRGLGTANTAIVYDGVPVSDIRTGQIDLSKYSSTFVESLELLQANMPGNTLPARTYASSSVLSINTRSFNIASLEKKYWQAGIRAGSFNYWQPAAGIALPFKKNWLLGMNAEALYSEGNYPYTVNNGNFSEKKKRSNSAVHSLQGEINLLKLFSDSSTLQVKSGNYHSKRGLPGAVIFFNDHSVQKQWDDDYFMQARYKKNIHERTSLLFSAKWSYDRIRYADPDYLNGQGGLDNRYTQKEFYFSAAAGHAFDKHLLIAASSDASFAKMDANLSGFAYPSRQNYWNNIAIDYRIGLWQLNGSMLLTSIVDHTRTGSATGNKTRLTPTLALGFKPSASSPFLLRAFYKRIFRMPTFGDLYYDFIGNTALRPELSSQYNIGITYSKRVAKNTQFNISADGYYNHVKDKIIAVPNQNLFVWTMLNVGKVDIRGVDVTAAINGSIAGQWKWFTRMAYTWQQAKDMSNPSGSTYKNRIPYTPDHSGSALFNLEYHGFTAGYDMLFSGSRYTLGENNAYNKLGGWISQDISVSRAFRWNAVNMNIRAELDNLADQRYEAVRYYPMPGRSFRISIFFNNL